RHRVTSCGGDLDVGRSDQEDLVRDTLDPALAAVGEPGGEVHHPSRLGRGHARHVHHHGVPFAEVAAYRQRVVVLLGANHHDASRLGDRLPALRSTLSGRHPLVVVLFLVVGLVVLLHTTQAKVARHLAHCPHRLVLFRLVLSGLAPTRGTVIARFSPHPATRPVI